MEDILTFRKLIVVVLMFAGLAWLLEIGVGWRSDNCAWNRFLRSLSIKPVYHCPRLRDRVELLGNIWHLSPCGFGVFTVPNPTDHISRWGSCADATSCGACHAWTVDGFYPWASGFGWSLNFGLRWFKKSQIAPRGKIVVWFARNPWAKVTTCGARRAWTLARSGQSTLALSLQKTYNLMLSHTATHGLLWTVELPSEQRITLFDFPNESLSPAEILRRHVPQFFRNVSDRVASLGTRGAWWRRVREFLITWGQRLHAGRCVETTPCCHDSGPKLGPGSGSPGSPGSPAPEVHVRSTNGTSISHLPAVFGICRKRYSRGWVELTFWGNGLQLLSSRFLLVEDQIKTLALKMDR